MTGPAGVANRAAVEGRNIRKGIAGTEPAMPDLIYEVIVLRIVKALIVPIVIALFLSACVDENINDTYTILDAHIDKMSTSMRGPWSVDITAQGKQYTIHIDRDQGQQIQKQLQFATMTNTADDLKYDFMVSGSFDVKAIALSRARQH